MKLKMPHTAYLECEYLGKGPFSEEIIRFKDNEGRTIDCFVDSKSVINLFHTNDYFLEVGILEEFPESVRVWLPLADNTSITHGGRYHLVDRFNLLSQKDLDTPN